MTTLRTTFWVSAGLLGLFALVAMPAAADFVINDDLIVDGSACIGFDCVNGEVFGFDTIRLKENNLRIKFEDTSVVAGFPTRTWQIIANDSNSGGLDRFSVEDTDAGRIPFTIEGNADAHSLYVDTGKRIGIGTNTPVLNLHVKTGNTPALRLEQDTSSGFTAQTWDLAGNETNFFVRDATNGSALPFRIQPGSPSNSIFVKQPAGDVGVGTSSPETALHVRRTNAGTTFARVENANAAAQTTGFTMKNTTATWSFNVNTQGNFQTTLGGSGGAEFEISDDAVGNTAKYAFRTGPNLLMEIQADGDVNSLTGAFGTISDRNAKRDINPVNPREVLAKLDEVPISTWRYKEHNDSVHMGPMAQDFYAAFGLHEGERSIALNDLSGVALAAIQGLSQELDERDAAIQELLARSDAQQVLIDELAARLAAIAEAD